LKENVQTPFASADLPLLPSWPELKLPRDESVPLGRTFPPCKMFAALINICNKIDGLAPGFKLLMWTHGLTPFF
jgi:hypothetical protein